MRWLNLVTPPAEAVEPVTLTEAKAHLRIDADITTYDQLVTDLIVAARDRAELETNRQLLTAGYQLVMDAFPCGPIELPRPPLQSVTAVTYVDAGGLTQTWSSSLYQQLAPRGPFAGRGLLMPVYGEIYPVTRPETLAAVTVAFTAGYGLAATTVPRSIRQACLLMIGDWFRMPEQMVIGENAFAFPLPVGAAALLRPFKSEPLQW